jgi:hypothetical protein
MTPYIQEFMVSKYNIHPGQFKCQICEKEVTSLRHYIDDKLLTWMCSDKHVSKVSLDTRRKKKNYD